MIKYLTVSEIADSWCVSEDLVLKYIQSGALVAVKLGRSWRINPKDLVAFEKAKLKRDQAELQAKRLVRV